MKTFRDILSEVASPKSSDEMHFRDKHLVQVIQHPVAHDHQHTGDIAGNTPGEKTKKHKRIADYKSGEDASVYEQADASDEAVAERMDRAHRMQIKKKIIDEKKLDPVGKEDDDIDNDGDVDRSDSYLHNRRKTVTSAIRKKYQRESVELAEKAVSQSQQKAAAIALAAKRGDIPKSKLQGASKGMLGMSKKDLEDFAKTKLKGLPLKVYEDLDAAELDEARKSSSYQFTHKPGDPESEKRLADLKQSVKGTGKRVVLQGRLGKDNPNAHKYSKNAPRAQYKDGKRINADVSGKSGAHSHQRIQKADAAHHDVYVYDRNESVELDEAETNYVIKHKKTKQVLNTHSDYATAKDEHEGLGVDKHEYGIYKQTKKDAALRNRNTYREEAEQLDELSPSTLQSYMKKAGKSERDLEKQHKDVSSAISKVHTAVGKKSAAANAAHRATTQAASNKAGAQYRAADKQIKDTSGLVKQKSDIQRKLANRMDGMGRASERLHKEEVEQIDEVSKNLLRKVGGKMLRKGLSDDPKAAKHMKSANLASAKLYPDQYKNSPLKAKIPATEEVEQIDELSKETLQSYKQKAHGEISKADSDRKAQNRRKGFFTAWSKILRKEESEQIDEISKSTLGSYATKALRRGDIAARMSHSDSDEMGKIADKRLTGVKKAVDKIAPKSAASRIKTNVDKARDAARNRGTDKDDQGKAYYAAQKGIAKVREEVELDEISKDTVRSYAGKAFSQANTLVKQSLSDQPKSVQKASTAAFKRRQFGIKAANRRLGSDEMKKIHSNVVGESVEQIDEAFKAGSVKLNDGSSILLKDQDAKLMNQLFADLNADNKKKMMKVAMTDKHGFNEILGFAREAL